MVTLCMPTRLGRGGANRQIGILITFWVRHLPSLSCSQTMAGHLSFLTSSGAAFLALLLSFTFCCLLWASLCFSSCSSRYCLLNSMKEVWWRRHAKSKSQTMARSTARRLLTELRFSVAKNKTNAASEAQKLRTSQSDTPHQLLVNPLPIENSNHQTYFKTNRDQLRSKQQVLSIFLKNSLQASQATWL